MNQRIKELAEQATKHYPATESSGEFSPFDKDKFAESIIRECIEQIQLTTARDPQHTPQYKQSVGHIHRIRQHFGIE